MLEHIVKNGEAIQDILNMYHLELEEVRNLNLHITDIHNLQSGMKIKIPVLHNEIEQILENTESFVQKYYPKLQAPFEEVKPPVPPVVLEKKEEEPLSPIPPKEERVIPKGRPYPGILPPKMPQKR